MTKKNNLDLARDEMTIADAARFLGHETSSSLSHLKARGKLHPRRNVGRFPIYDVRALDEYAGNWGDVRVTPNEAAEMCGKEHYVIRHAASTGKILYCYQIGNRWQISVNGLRRAGFLAPSAPAAGPERTSLDEPEQTSLDVADERDVKDEETIESLRRRLDAAERERDLAVRERWLMEEAENERVRTLVEEGAVDLDAAMRLADTRRILREIGQPGGGRLRDLVNLLDALDAIGETDERPVVLPGGDY